MCTVWSCVTTAVPSHVSGAVVVSIQVGYQEKALHREGGQALKQGCGLVFELLIGGGIQKTREREGVWD